MRYLIGLLLLVGCSTEALGQVTQPTHLSATTRKEQEVAAQESVPLQSGPVPIKELGIDKVAEANHLRRLYPCDEWLDASVAAGWPVELWHQQSFVMWRESRCRPFVRSQTSDSGLMQVNDFWCKPSAYTDRGWLQDQGIVQTCADLMDPLTNLIASRAIFNYSHERNQNGWNPWRMAADFDPPVVND